MRISFCAALALCLLSPLLVQTLTDKDGTYSLNVSTGNLSLSVLAEGYASFWRAVTVEKDQTATVNCVLDVWVPVKLPPGPAPGRWLRESRGDGEAEQIKAALMKETHDKCAYCESKVGHNCPGDAEHKIPVSHDAQRLFD